MTNKEISKLFLEVAASYTIKNEKKYRFQIIAYQKAAEAIEGSPYQVIDLYKEGKLDEIPGVGPTIKLRLEELIKTGRVKHFDDVKKGISPAVFRLMEIPSFGPKKAYKIATEFNLKNEKTALEDVRKLAIEGKIEKIEGFGKKSEEDLLTAVEEFKKGKGKTTKMILPYALEIANDIIDHLKKHKAVLDAKPLGSLRRMKSMVGDIDIAVSTNNPKEVIEHFTNYPRRQRLIEKGAITSSFLTTGGNQVDLMVLPPSQFGSLLQHFTGSKDHNVSLREFALGKNLSLNEKGIKNLKTGKLTKYSTEEDFYKALGMQWIPPELRENTGEIEASKNNKLPNLVEVKDIKGDFHLHSSFPVEESHDPGKSSIEELVKKARGLNYEYIGLSEHNPSQSKHTNDQIVRLLEKRNKEAEKVEKRLNFKIFKLMETDILPNGKLALPQDALKILDATIVSIHSVFIMKKEDMTKRVIEGLSHPKAKILAHPSGRLLGKRAGYELDYDLLFDFCKKNNKAIEINAHPKRLDLDESLVKIAVERGVMLVINTDSHEKDQMDLMYYGVAIARRGWAEKDDIINTMSYNEVLDFFKK